MHPKYVEPIFLAELARSQEMCLRTAPAGRCTSDRLHHGRKFGRNDENFARSGLEHWHDRPSLVRVLFHQVQLEVALMSTE